MEIAEQYLKVREFITSLIEKGATQIECASLLQISTFRINKILNKGEIKSQRNYTFPVFRRFTWLEKEKKTLQEFNKYLELKRKFNRKGDTWREV